MYLKECIKIITIIYNENSSQEEQNLLLNIFKYINNNICYIDNNNKYLNYTNKFYMLNNDFKTTKLISLMNIIHRLNNDDIKNEYFELLSNIYSFQFNYNSFNWTIYELLEPLLVNIDKKDYSIIEKEISFPEFLFDFIKYLIKKERIFLNNNPYILKNGFYFGENNHNAGIIAEIDKLNENSILSFGFKFIIKDGKMKDEYIILQFKSIKDDKTQLKFSLIKKNDKYYLTSFDNRKKAITFNEIIPFKYYIFSIQIREKLLNVSLHYDKEPEFIMFDVPKIKFDLNNLYLIVACDIEKKNVKDKSFHKNVKYINKFTGFIGDIHIINTKSFKENKNDKFYLQRNILNLKGKYGFTIIKSIKDQSNLEEYIYSNLEESTVLINQQNLKNEKENEDFFNIYIKKENLKNYKIIDNIALLISSFNFKLIDYMDNIDYMNYDNCYYEKEKELNKIKKENQYFNNYRTKTTNFNNKIIEISKNLFNCNFNIFENKYGLLKFFEEDGIFFLILILEYYYQILFKIMKDNDKDDDKNNEKLQMKILEHIEKGMESIISFFFKKVIDTNLSVKPYKITIFYYQMNVVIKQYIFIKNISENMYELLLYYLQKYQSFIKANFIKANNKKDNKELDNPIKYRNFFFDFLLNRYLYKIEKDFNSLKHFNKMIELLNKIIIENYYNEELLQKVIFIKLLNLIYILQEFNDYINDNQINNLNNEITVSTLHKKHFQLLIDFVKSMKSNKKIDKDLIISFCDNIISNFNNTYYFYNLSIILYITEIIFEVPNNFINDIKTEFEKNYLLDEDKNKILSISSMFILMGYYFFNQKDITKIKEFRKNFNFLDLEQEKKLISYLLKVFKLFLKDYIEINDIINDKSQDDIIFNDIDLKKLNPNQEKYIDLFFKYLLLFTDESEESNILFYNAKEEKFNLFYENIKNNLFVLLNEKKLKIFKNLFSSENFICPQLFYYKLKFSKENEKQLVENDIIKFTKELITYHNYPFIFELIKIINENLYENDNNHFKDEENQREKKKKNLINIVINILNVIFESLENYKIDLKNRKRNKYYVRGLINLLLTINNIAEMKEILYNKNKIFINIFVNLVKLIDKISLIYSNYCIKNDDSSGKLISEFILDTLGYLLMANEDNVEIKELFNKIFIKGNKNNKIYFTLFYLIDLIKLPKLDKNIKQQLENILGDISKIKEMNNLLKTKKSYKLNKLEVLKNLPNYKCVFPLENVNLCIYFCAKISIFLYNKDNKIKDEEFNKYLNDIFLNLLNQNIFRLKTKWKKYYNENIYEKFQLYQLTKIFYDRNVLIDLNNLKPLKEFLEKELPIKLKEKYDIKCCYSSSFIWNFSDSDKEFNQNNIDKMNLKDGIKHQDINQFNNFLLNESFADLHIDDNDNDNKDNEDENKSKRGDSMKSKKEKKRGSIKEDLHNKLELAQIKEDFREDRYFSINYFCFMDDIKYRCLIFNPKNMLIKRIFSHIYYKLIFYDKTFMYIKNKYLRTFLTANVYTKQLNYPSKVKNYSNFYEPKIFLKKDFNFYEPNLFLKTDSMEKSFFKISHDFLIKENPYEKPISDIKVKETKKFINSTLYTINFYKHRFNVYDDILNEDENYFDCELVTGQFVYFGYIIFGKDYIFYGTKKKPPIDYSKKKKEDYDIEKFLRYCFTIRNRDNSTDKKKSLIIYYQDIKQIIKRRMLLMYQSFEFFCQNGKSYFFNLFKKENCDKAFKILKKINSTLDDKDKFEIYNENIDEEVKKINNEVKSGIINNYLYLSKINFFSSRSFNELGQYPVFPWIILNFDKLDNLLINAYKNNSSQIEIINDDNINENGNVEEEGGENKNLKVSIKNNNQELFNECGLRVFNYPLSMQTEEKREHSIEKFGDDEDENDGKFKYHHGAHYSTCSYVYFFLMRNNPYTQCLIKLQNYAKENPNRLFISYSDTLSVFKTLPENRELIPDIFCHFDYYCNLNCAYNGNKSNGTIVDDLYDNGKNSQIKYSDNMNSIYLKFVYLFRKLLNSNLISIYLPDWIDNIFGKNQLPDNPKKLKTSCNIFSKSTYEQKMNLDEKVKKYLKKYDNKEMDKKEFLTKILLRIDLINNFGCTPHKVLDDTIHLKTSTKLYTRANKCFKINTNIYFIKNNDNILILFKNEKEGNKIKKIACWETKSVFKDNKMESLDKKNIYSCGFIKQLKKNLFIDVEKKIHKFPIFKPCYSMSKFVFSNKLYILTCRYLGNIFKVQNSDYYIDVLCEDFVTCLVCKENIKTNLDDILIYTGLKNGKLIEWFIKEKQSQKIIIIREKKNCHCHRGEITCIELYENQNVIITGGKDKMIFVRKIYDFELLTVINLTYLYGNPIIGQKINIVPTLIKVSKLNCIYIMIYNYETKKSFIRGYNLNGLFFAQSEENDFMNICFTKNNNLLISFYNQDKISVFNCYDLKSANFDLIPSTFVKPIKKKKNEKEIENDSLVWIEYNYNKQEFIILYESKIIKGCIEDKEKQIEFSSY